MSVLELLDGLRLHALPSWAEEQVRPEVARPLAGTQTPDHDAVPGAPRVIKIFLASSEELHVDRDEFELHVSRLNQSYLRKGVCLQVVRWENFLDAMSETRLQNEYNREVQAADLFVSLCMTKTGKYTEEEFDVAHASFKQHGRPQIFTFFRETQMANNEDSLTALTTLVAFQKKLESLGHFPTKYKNQEDLKVLFRRQLDQLEDAGWFTRERAEIVA